MAASDYTPSNTLWATIKRLASGDALTAALLYDLALVKVFDSIRWCVRRMRALYTEAVVFTATNATDTFTSANHCLENGDTLRVSTTSALPTGLTTGTTYYVINRSESDFQLSLTLGGAAVAISDDGVGVQAWTIRGAGMLEAGNIWSGTNAFTGAVGVTGLFSPSGRSTVPAGVALADVDQTIDVGQGRVFLVPDPAALRTIKLRTTTSPIPVAGERIDCIMPGPVTSNIIEFQRENATPIVTFSAGIEMAKASFMFIGGVWRCIGTAGDDGTKITDGAGY